ncbi:Uncharacterised protein [Klebsiella pneumoniae]|uniref:Uncharacterized protein n=1 Tax=Klebsiella pneumoniae TaxID=573 RepID=A0A377WQL2_KLEPN|nr:Uncharacterised protein [Klebsiella pneumoniae]
MVSADYDVTVNGLRWLLEALLQSGTFTVLTAFTAAHGRAGFFTISFRFSVFVAFLRRTSRFCCYGYGRDRLRLHDRYHLQPDEHAVMW